MKKFVVLFLFVVGIASSGFAGENQLRLMRYPDVGHGIVVFSYQGDLWQVPQVGGKASRLTIHDGFETHPKISPDGKWIAFTGEYNGGTNVFIIPFEGGTPRQLTYYPGTETVVGWTPDSRNVVFSANRTAYSRFYDELWQVNINGHFPEKLPVDRGSCISFSPDGKKFAYNRHPMMFWWWKRYKGTFNHDVWVFDTTDKSFHQLTTWIGNDSWPMWGKDGKIYFASERKKISNIFSIEPKSKSIKQVTFHTDDGVQWPSMSSDGKWIVYENNGRLFLLNVGKKQTKEIVVTAPLDYHYDLVTFENPTKYMNGFDISPSGKRVVIGARGEIFSLPAEHGIIRNLSNTASGREQHPAWSPDGKYVAYVSDINGEQEVYIVDQMGKTKPIQLTKSKKFKFGLKWSPDSHSILFYTNNHYLYLLDVSSKKVTEVAYNPANIINDYSWSPDGKWIAYSFTHRNYMSDIFVYSLEKKKSMPFIVRSNDDYDPVFTADGKDMIFVSSPYPGRKELHAVHLLPEEKQPFQKEDDEEKLESVQEKSSPKEKSKKKKSNTKAKEEKIVVKIDFHNVNERIRRVSVSGMDFSHLGSVKNFYYYIAVVPGAITKMQKMTSGRALYAYNLKELKSIKIATGIASYKIAAKHKKILLWTGRNLKIADVGKPVSKSAKSVKLKSVVMKIDRPKEWQEIFDEGWRMVRDYFYDPHYHGVDWGKVKKHYRSLLPYVHTRRELSILMAEMVGELNASHQGVRGGDVHHVKKYAVGLLGAQLAPDYKAGYYRFVKIYKGDKDNKRYRSPLDADYIKIKPGDYLLAIDGNPVKVNENYLKYLEDKNKTKITLLTNSEPSMKGAVATKIFPLVSDYSLRVKEWTDKNTRLVDSLSQGKVGYMHLENMGGNDLNTFKKYFQDYRYKEAIIIDVRYNGGGGIDPELIDMLERRPYQITRERDSEPVERPDNGFYGNVVVLCNEYSFSDAEVFPNGFHVRKLGTLIGKQTLGFVIAVSPYSLIDGGQIRKTFVGLWDVNGNQLEGRGAIPDISVENTPEDEIQGRDSQLLKAIEYLNQKIKRHPRNYNYNIPIRSR